MRLSDSNSSFCRRRGVPNPKQTTPRVSVSRCRDRQARRLHEGSVTPALHALAGRRKLPAHTSAAPCDSAPSLARRRRIHAQREWCVRDWLVARPLSVAGQRFVTLFCDSMHGSKESSGVTRRVARLFLRPGLGVAFCLSLRTTYTQLLRDRECRPTSSFNSLRAALARHSGARGGCNDSSFRTFDPLPRRWRY